MLPLSHSRSDCGSFQTFHSQHECALAPVLVRQLPGVAPKIGPFVSQIALPVAATRNPYPRSDGSSRTQRDALLQSAPSPS